MIEEEIKNLLEARTEILQKINDMKASYADIKLYTKSTKYTFTRNELRALFKCFDEELLLISKRLKELGYESN